MTTLPTVAYLGPAGTYSQAAAVRYFQDQCQLIGCGSIDEVFAAVENQTAQYGVVPVENSTEGAVNNTQDCLVDSPVQIVGEIVIPIEHHLLVSPQYPDREVSVIASHKQSLAQCRGWLQANFPGVPTIECVSNAEAARLAQEQPGTAAIAGEMAASLYGLSIKHAAIQDQQHNRTRFLVLACTSAAASGRDKTSVLIYAENKPGALFRILEPFNDLKISLTRLETRPSKKEAWEYVFFMDFEGHRNDSAVAELFRRLAGCAAEVKVLGSYPAAT